MGNAELWKDHDWPNWTPTIGTTQITSTYFVIERDMDQRCDDDQYFVLAQDGDEEDEKDNRVTSYWSEDDCDWSFDKDNDIPSNNEKISWDITKALCVWEPLKNEDQFVELQTLFKEEDKEEGGAA